MATEAARERGEVRVVQARADRPAGVGALLVHADRPVHAVVDDDRDDGELLARRGRELLPGHQEVAVAGETDHDALGVDELRRDRGREAVAHRAAGRGELREVVLERPVAVPPHRVVAGAVGEDRVGRQPLAHRRDDLAEIERERAIRGDERRDVLAASRLRPRLPARPVQRRQSARRAEELPGRRDDAEHGLEDAPELLGRGEDVNQGLLRRGRAEQGVAGGGGVAETRTNAEDHVGVEGALRDLRRHADADRPDVGRRAPVEVRLAAEGVDDRDAVRLSEGDRVGPRLARPVAAADNHQRALGLAEQLERCSNLREAGRRARGHVRLRVGDRGGLGQHVLRQRHHHGPGPARCRNPEGACHHLGQARRIVHLDDPLGERPEHRDVVDLLERLAAAIGTCDLADQQQHRRRVLHGDVDARRRMRGARGARHEADAGLPGELPVRLCSVGSARLHAADDEMNGPIV